MSRTGRHPLPALALIVVLAVLTAVVWWRVLHRPKVPSAAGSSVGSTACAAPTVLPRPANVAVAVLNGAARAGLAGNVSTTLRQRGFQVGRVDNAPQTFPGAARVAYGTGLRNAALLVSFYLPGAELVEVPSNDRTITVTLGAKFTGVAAPDAVQRAITQAHAVVGTPTAPANGAPTAVTGPDGSTATAAAC